MKVSTLLEQSDFDRLIDVVVTQCTPYINEFIKLNGGSWQGQGLIRGMNYSTNDHYGVNNIRENRRPSSTARSDHNLLNSLFKQKFGSNLRSESMFAVLSKGGKGDVKESEAITEEYGETYYVFPVGPYQIVYSEDVEDLYSEIDMEGSWYDYYDKESKKSEQMLYKDALLKWFEDLNYKQVNSISQINNNRIELMITASSKKYAYISSVAMEEAYSKILNRIGNIK